MTQTGSMGLISAAHLSRGTPGRNSKIMGDLVPLDKAGSGPPMPQQARADDPDDQNHAGTDQRRHRTVKICARELMRNERLIPVMRFGALCRLVLVVKKPPPFAAYISPVFRSKMSNVCISTGVAPNG
jgi:hypothetical protein